MKNTDARKLGIIAAMNNKTYDENPFEETTDEHWEWFGGWLEYMSVSGDII